MQFLNGGANVVLGYSGDDELHGLEGNDWIDGGPGNDFLHGGSGMDWCTTGESFEACESSRPPEKTFRATAQREPITRSLLPHWSLTAANP